MLSPDESSSPTTVGVQQDNTKDASKTTLIGDDYLSNVRSRLSNVPPPKPATNPLQFVKARPCALYRTAQEQLKRSEEVKQAKLVVREDAEDWQSNLDNWKSSRRKRVEHIIDRVVEAKKLEQEEHNRNRRRSKTFSEMLEERSGGSRRKPSLAFYAEEDDATNFSDSTDLDDNLNQNRAPIPDDSSKCAESSDTNHTYSKSDDKQNANMNGNLHHSPNNMNYEPIVEIQSDSNSRTNSNTTEYTYEGAINDYKSRVTNWENRNGFNNKKQPEPSNHSISNSVPKTEILKRTEMFEKKISKTAETVFNKITPEKIIPSQCIKERLSLLEIKSRNDDAVFDISKSQRSKSSENMSSVRDRLSHLERRTSQDSKIQNEIAPCASDSITSADLPLVRSGSSSESVRQSSTDYNDTDRDDSGIHTADVSCSVSQADEAGELEESLINQTYTPYTTTSFTTPLAAYSDQEDYQEDDADLNSVSQTVADGMGSTVQVSEAIDIALEEFDRQNSIQNYDDQAAEQFDTNSYKEEENGISLMESDNNDTSVSEVMKLSEPVNEVQMKDLIDTTRVLNLTDTTDLTRKSDVMNASDLIDTKDLTKQPDSTRLSNLIEFNEVTQVPELPGELMKYPVPIFSTLPEGEGIEIAPADRDTLSLLAPVRNAEPPKEKPPPPPLEQDMADEPSKNGHSVNIKRVNSTRRIRDELRSKRSSFLGIDSEESLLMSSEELIPPKPPDITAFLCRERQLEHQMYRQSLSSDSSHLGDQSESRDSGVELDRRSQSDQSTWSLTSQAPIVLQEDKPMNLIRTSTELMPQSLAQSNNDDVARKEQEIIERLEQEELSKQQRSSHSDIKKDYQIDNQYPSGKLQQINMVNLPYEQDRANISNDKDYRLQDRLQRYDVVSNDLSFDEEQSEEVLRVERELLQLEQEELRRQRECLQQRREWVPPIAPGHPLGMRHYASAHDVSVPAMDVQMHKRRPPAAALPIKPASGDGMQMSRNTLHALSCTPRSRHIDSWVLQKRKSEPPIMNYNQHWLIQEAEQRRIEQQRGLKCSNQPWLQQQANRPEKHLSNPIMQPITQRSHNRTSLNPDMLNRRYDVKSMRDILPQNQSQEKMLSVSGKKKCSHCGDELGRGAAMIIESLQLFYHIDCFKCCVCRVQLGDGLIGTDVRVRNHKLHCHNCYSSDDGVKFSCV